MDIKVTRGLVILTLAILMSIGCFAQYKTQVQEHPTLEKAIKLPGQTNTTGLNLFDPNRFSMDQSYSMMMGIGGSNSGSMGMYMNNMSYIFSKNLILNAKLGFVHNPLQMGNTVNNNMANNLIYGADVLYKPTENMRLQISFSKRPYTSRYFYNPYRYYDRY
ncbi:MAG: hypothetical protein K9M80_03390 [Candidatus Marinimicrobia bacterium]|nr:hypothetical protein [Candidatus Neomarinimicrobiota bacterium]